MINLPGVQFMLGEDIEMLRDAVATFAAKEITPRAAVSAPVESGRSSASSGASSHGPVGRPVNFSFRPVT